MSVLFEKIAEFERFASMLQMPVAERIGILNISSELYSGLRTGSPASISKVRPEFERRLSYALPLMRRLAGNLAVVGLPTGSRKAA